MDKRLDLWTISLTWPLITLLTLLLTQISHADDSFDHDTTGFLLSGAHSRLRCESCHMHGIFKGTPLRCQGCHGQASTIATTRKGPVHIESNEACDDCHTEVSWLNARMDHVAITGSCVSCHNGVKAAGKHSRHVQSHNRCEDCHRTIAWKPARFDHSGITGSCFSCHNGTTAKGKSPNHIQSGNSCEDCHRTTGWVPAGFDHSNITSGCFTCHNGTRATGKSPGHIASSNNCDDCHRTSAWIPATFDHSSITGTCFSCHNGTTATGKSPNHISSGNNCEDCHRTTAWVPATGFDHSNVSPGTCNSCHNGTTATGKSPNHFITSLQCDVCHNTTSFFTANYTHNLMGITHNANVRCRDCHTSNNATITYQFPAYRPNCAACHAGDYKADPHKKHENPDVKYSVSELQDCTGSCHIYTDSTLTTIKERRNSRHRATAGSF